MMIHALVIPYLTKHENDLSGCQLCSGLEIESDGNPYAGKPYDTPQGTEVAVVLQAYINNVVQHPAADVAECQNV